jgi:hypothetical protein
MGQAAPTLPLLQQWTVRPAPPLIERENPVVEHCAKAGKIKSRRPDQSKELRTRAVFKRLLWSPTGVQKWTPMLSPALPAD